ncbi:hypothetical protein [Halolamina salina]|uniref:LexA-binding, inner membrane-associated hydrolase n=1 Tax=Halolamina salina TaxID=1220023 RepID=A0ABD6B9Y3_9EURY
MIETFPADRVPDGAVFGPHHAYLGLLLALLAVALVWDDATGAEPWVGAAALLAASFAFATIWKFYPQTGAALALAGIVIALASTLLPFWSSYPWLGPRGVLLVGAIVALDDVAEHAFGVPTPLDWLWTHHLVQHIH